jgi:hypothetical protein
MSDKYTLKIHSHNPEVAEKLINQKIISGNGLFDMLQDTIHNLNSKLSSNSFMPADSPFFSLAESDFDPKDPIVMKFFDNGGLKDAVKSLSLPANEAKVKVIECYNTLANYRQAMVNNNIRKAYFALQNAIDSNSAPVRLERIANKTEQRSSGYWQIEALNQIDQATKISNLSEFKTLQFARNLVLQGDKDYYKTASEMIKSVFASTVVKSNIRVAYTTLSTQDNEPFLLCPKGIFQGSHKAAVPMEVSKCRENCIDSRVSKDGIVSCAYQDWLKVAFEPHDKVMARLDVHHHPDNEANALELKEGERSHKLKDTDLGFEARFDHSDRGANKQRGKQNLTESREKQLDNLKSNSYGHTREDETRKAPKQAQTNSNRVIEDQLPRKEQKSDHFLEALLDKLNRKESVTDEVRENQLDEKGLYNHRGEMEESYSAQLDNRKQENLDYKAELNKDFDEPEESVAHLLNKTANKKSTTLNGELEESRKNIKTDDTKEMQLKEKRTIKKDADIDKNIESLLDENDDYHQFSDEDLKHFAHELGLDSYLEDLRTDNDIES